MHGGANLALQWLYVDPTNESAYTHARSIAILFHTLMVRMALASELGRSSDREVAWRSWRDRLRECGARPPALHHKR